MGIVSRIQEVAYLTEKTKKDEKIPLTKRENCYREVYREKKKVNTKFIKWGHSFQPGSFWEKSVKLETKRNIKPYIYIYIFVSEATCFMQVLHTLFGYDPYPGFHSKVQGKIEANINEWQETKQKLS